MIEIIGKNGSGKTYLANHLSYMGYDKCIAYTTREMRRNEKNGRDYHFITKEDFLEGIEKEEWVDYKERNGFFYGMKKKDIHPDTILVSGNSKTIEEKTGYPVTKVFLDCDMPVRYRRVKGRKESEEELFSRFHGENFSFLENFDAIFIDNTNPSTNALETVKAILEQEKTFLNEKNHSYLQKKLLKNKEENNDSLLELLQAEERILRFLAITDSLKKENYQKSIKRVLEEKNIPYIQEEDIILKEKQYHLDYKKIRS